MSDSSQPTTITITLPMDPVATGWSQVNLLRVAAATADALAAPVPLFTASGGSTACQRRVVYSQSATGQITQQIEVLVCDGACGSPDSECEWVPVQLTLAMA